MDTTRRRILNSDGSSAVHRIGYGKRAWVGDLGHALLTITWTRFMAIVGVGYVLINVGFALMYLGCGNCIENATPGAFADSFFFSVQTLATIGYGGMVPKGLLANLLVAVEALFGMMFLALVASLAYARFTRATAGVRFADKAVVGTFDGKPALMFRIANQRADEIIEASASLSMVHDMVLASGERFRRIVDLPLMRSVSPVFALSWTVIHIIDETSPLFGTTKEDLVKDLVEILVLFTGHHEGFGQRVHARRVYAWWELEWNARFADMMSQQPSGQRTIDMSRFNLIEPLGNA